LSPLPLCSCTSQHACRCVAYDAAVEQNIHPHGASYDGARRTAFYDGVPVGYDIPPAGSHDAIGASLRIGVTGKTDFFHGFIAHVRVWSIARTPTEIQDYMDQVLPEDAPGLVGDWHLDDGGSDAIDSSGSGLDGRLRGPRYIISAASL